MFVQVKPRWGDPVDDGVDTLGTQWRVAVDARGTTAVDGTTPPSRPCGTTWNLTVLTLWTKEIRGPDGYR